MKFYSTRSKAVDSARDNDTRFLDAVRTGLAPDGGLYLPRVWPKFSVQDFSHEVSKNFSTTGAFHEVSVKLLTPFLCEDFTPVEITSIVETAFSFPLVIKKAKPDLSVLELFHGPTAAFKDFGARFLAQALAHAQGKSENNRDRKRSCVLVATSGDTGAAVAAAFHAATLGNSDIEVFVLYPQGRVSSRQEKQLTAWGGNVRSFQVEGSFDDCQRLVKEVFQSHDKSDSNNSIQNINWISANSINLGRWLPQTCAFAYASLKHFQETGQKISFSVPTGNLGNGLAAMVAKKMGFPIRKVLLASNANHSVTDFFQTLKFSAHPSIATLANAMDIGNPSNMERLQALWPSAEALSQLKSWVSAVSVSDAQILEQIEKTFQETGEVICPHTATAIYAAEKAGGDWTVAATAHPSKFPEVSMRHAQVKIPEALQELLDRPGRFEVLAPNLDAFVKILSESPKN